MEFDTILRRRRMVRSFTSEPVPTDVLTRVLAAAVRAPSAGNTQGTDLIVLEGPDQTARYWDVTLPSDRRADFPWPGLLAAPVLVVPVASRSAYLARYSEPDKVSSPLGTADRWAVPYWYVDTAFAAMLIQLAAIDENLGVLFFGIFENTDALAVALGIPEGHLPIGTIALGYPSDADDRPSRSSQRPRRTLDDVVHRGRW